MSLMEEKASVPMVPQWLEWSKESIPNVAYGKPYRRGNVCPARYFPINYADFSPRFTLPWRSPPKRPHCTAHLPYKARGKIKQYL